MSIFVRDLLTNGSCAEICFCSWCIVYYFKLLYNDSVYLHGFLEQITYGDPRVRIPHLKSEEAPWEIKLHVIRMLSTTLPWVVKGVMVIIVMNERKREATVNTVHGLIYAN